MERERRKELFRGETAQQQQAATETLARSINRASPNVRDDDERSLTCFYFLFHLSLPLSLKNRSPTPSSMRASSRTPTPRYEEKREKRVRQFREEEKEARERRGRIEFSTPPLKNLVSLTSLFKKKKKSQPTNNRSPARPPPRPT